MSTSATAPDRRRLLRLLGAVAAGVSIGVAVVFVVGQFVYFEHPYAFTGFRGWHFHVPMAEYYRSVGLDPEAWRAVSFGPNGSVLTHYPPLGYLVDALALAVAGPGALPLYRAALLWWVALFVLSFALGARVGESALAGATVAALFAFNFAVLEQIHAINFDLAMTAMVAAAALAALASDGFNKWPASLLAGLLGGAAILVRPTAPAFLLPIFFGVWLIRPDRRAVRLLPLGAAGALAVAVWAWYYLPIAGSFFRDTRHHAEFDWSHILDQIRAAGAALLDETTAWEKLAFLLAIALIARRRDRFGILFVLWVVGATAIMVLQQSPATPQESLLAAYLGLCLAPARATRDLGRLGRAGAVLLVALAALLIIDSRNLWIVATHRTDLQRSIESGEVTSWPSRVIDYINEAEFFDQFPVRDALRVTLRHAFPTVPPARIAIVGPNATATNLVRNCLGVDIGLDRPATIATAPFMTHVESAEGGDALFSDPPADFAAKVGKAALILSVGPRDEFTALLARCEAPDASGPECANLAALRAVARPVYRLPYHHQMTLWFWRPLAEDN